MRRLQTILVVFAVLALGTSGAPAQNLLVNGDFEFSPVDNVPGWSLEKSVTDLPGVNVNSAQQQGFANQPAAVAGEFGLWLRAFAGNQAPVAGENRMINAVLSQTVPGTEGEDYTFSGWARFEPNYSGGVSFLDVASPSGEVPSPTQSIFELAFLNASNDVIGMPVTLDLRDAGQFGDNEWHQHTLMGSAPAGTANVRVTASALDMIANINPMQSGMYDNFSLTTAGAPATELLTNADLNETAPELPGWTLVELPEGTDTAGRGGGFANNPATGGSGGYWLKAFAGGDAFLSQSVPGVEGGEYTFSAWSAFGMNYSGGLPGSATETLLELSFLDADEQVIDSLLLDLVEAGQVNAPGPIGQHPEAWRQFSINGIAPAGTAFVQVGVTATGMFATENPDQGAFFDDLSLTLATVGLPGDFNNDGVVDAADYTVWRDGLGTEFTPEQYNEWKGNFGATAVGSGAALAASAVPEPTTGVFVAIAVLLGAGLRRRVRWAL